MFCCGGFSTDSKAIEWITWQMLKSKCRGASFSSMTPSEYWCHCILIVTAAEWNEGASKSKSFSSEHRYFFPSVIFFQGYCLILSAAKTISILRCCNSSSTTLLSPNRQRNPVVMECLWTKLVPRDTCFAYVCGAVHDACNIDILG